MGSKNLRGSEMFWSKAQAVTEQAMFDGSLYPISTEPRVLIDNGVRYFLHLKNANSKIKFSPKPKDFNPFLPYEPAMFVDFAGNDHVCLLNKFPVLSPHLLICTKDFVEQTMPLTLSDFQAWTLGYDDPKVLGFYNGGPIAGASQPHRHMQLVNTDIPLEKVIIDGQLPFEHRLFNYKTLNAQTLHNDYIAAIKAMSLYNNAQCEPYNVLLTNQWMLVLPRSRNNIEGVFANGINYSGHFLITNESQIKWLKDFGVMRFLSECAVIPKFFL